MPRLRKKLINGQFYVRWNIRGSVATYQTKSALHERFVREGRKNRDYIDQQEVIRFIHSGDLYKKGSSRRLPGPHPELGFHPVGSPNEPFETQSLESTEKSPPDEEINSLEFDPEPDPERKVLAIALVALVFLAVLVLWIISGA